LVKIPAEPSTAMFNADRAHVHNLKGESVEIYKNRLK